MSYSWYMTRFFNSEYQKQPSRGVLKKRCSENMQQIYRRIPVLKCDFNKVAFQLYWNYTRHECCPVNLLHIVRTSLPKNTSGRLLLEYQCWRIVAAQKKLFWLLMNCASDCWRVVLNNCASNFWKFKSVTVEQSCQWPWKNRAGDCWTTCQRLLNNHTNDCWKIVPVNVEQLYHPANISN